MVGTGGATRSPWPPDSYASSVSHKRHKKLMRNVINVCLEKNGRELDTFGYQLVGEICQKIGVSIGTQTLGSQVHFNPREIVVSVVLKPEIGPEQFCSQEVQYLRENLGIVAVKPDSSRVVKMRLVGLYISIPQTA